MAQKGWNRRFDDPITLADGAELTTLREAVAYLARTVPEAEQNDAKILAAAEILTYAAEREIAWVFLARMATLQAFHRKQARVINDDRKETHWGQAQAGAGPVSSR